MSNDAKREANRLAFNIGMFTGACDAYLGRHHFAAKARVRAKENTLTEAYFDELRAEAKLLGVPEDVIPATRPNPY